MKKKLFVLFAGVLLSTACQNQFLKESSFKRSGSENGKEGSQRNFSLVCWNTQTFFDAVTTGTEYKDFKNSERWTREKYTARLDKLCDVMTSLNPDIFVMEEIENEAVVHDIANMLTSGSWEHKKNWQYVCFTKETGSAIGCAVFSRYEIISVKTHSMDIRSQKTEQPSSRPLMQVTVLIGNNELELFVNHWKSKSGGEEETEIWRDWQEAVLAESASQCKNSPVVMCGDFNRSAEDFIYAHTGNIENTVLRGAENSLNIYSPWFKSDGSFSLETGSYFYNGEWERIDSIMVAGNASVVTFDTVTDSPVADENGIPSVYKIYTGEGCSDHLPLKCVLAVSR